MPNKPKTKKSEIDTTPSPRIHFEKIGDTEWQIEETELDLDDVRLWAQNPRLEQYLQGHSPTTDAEIEAILQKSRGYDNLLQSIKDLGQMEAVYCWRRDHASKYLVLEGATRVTILRDLARKHASGPKASQYERVKAKILPPHFGTMERVILLALIHVRGSGVRMWGRYTEAKFIWQNVSDTNDRKAVMSITQMAKYMGKSVSWVQRLRDAYEFAQKFIDYVDDEDEGKQLAASEFSTLEEIAKATNIGPKLREYDNKEFDQLRADVFDMVRKRVFKEYRDARFMKEFYEDKDKWAQLKTGEKDIAHRLAADLKASSSSLKVRISGLEQAVQRALGQEGHGLDDEDAAHLRSAMMLILENLHQGARPFHIELKNITDTLNEASLADVKTLAADVLREFGEAVDYFNGLVEKKNAKGGKAA